MSVLRGADAVGRLETAADANDACRFACVRFLALSLADAAADSPDVRDESDKRQVDCDGTENQILCCHCI